MNAERGKSLLCEEKLLFVIDFLKHKIYSRARSLLTFLVLFQAGIDRRINNFGKDIKDSEIYSHLIHQIAPKDRGVNKKQLQLQDLLQRAEGTLDQADKLDCRAFVAPQDIVNGVEKLNLAFVANLFNNFPALDEPEEGPVIEETREEKSKSTFSFQIRPLGAFTCF